MNLTGSSFGLLKVIGKVLLIPGKIGVYWLCRCECGCLKAVRTNNLTGGNVRSCGRCGKIKHGLYKTLAYSSWVSMKRRCLDENDASYDLYGGRGIGVCDEWLNFEAFYRDMGERPEGTTLERIDVDGDYCKDNCKWASSFEQSRNRRSNRFITAFGETLCFADAATKYGLSKGCLEARLKKYPPEIALTLPLSKTKPRKE